MRSRNWPFPLCGEVLCGLIIYLLCSEPVLAISTPQLCSVELKTPDKYKIAKILGASHQTDRVPRFILSYGDKGAPISTVTPDFIPQYVRLQSHPLPVGADNNGCLTRKGRYGKPVKDCSYVEPSAENYEPFKTTDEQWALIVKASSIFITPLFFRDRSVFCMAQAATLLGSSGAAPPEAKTIESRILFFTDAGAPLNSTIVIEYEKQ